MVFSKDMQPLSSPFFPIIFFNNQFRSKTAWPPKDTNLTGKVAIVTGANQGLGLEASDQLLSLRLSYLVIAVRSIAKGEAATDMLRAKYPKATIDVFQLDMSSYLKRRRTENEGRTGVPSTGHEETIQVNYLSTSLLSILILPILKRKSAEDTGQLTIVGSGLAFAAKFRNRSALPLLPSFDEARNFDVVDQYNTSKLLGMMFLYKLADYVCADDVVVNLVDPGFVKGTGLSRDMSSVALAIMTSWKHMVARPLDVGASTYVDAAVVKGKGSHGCYIMSWEISPFAPLLYSQEGNQRIKRLWEETITELSFADVQGVLDSLKAT